MGFHERLALLESGEWGPVELNLLDQNSITMNLGTTVESNVGGKVYLSQNQDPFLESVTLVMSPAN